VAARFIAGKAKFKVQAAAAAVPGMSSAERMVRSPGYACAGTKNASCNLPGLAVSAAIAKVGARQSIVRR
jgi:hypothetical protein